jgi:hypothetical protein
MDSSSIIGVAIFAWLAVGFIASGFDFAYRQRGHWLFMNMVYYRSDDRLKVLIRIPLGVFYLIYVAGENRDKHGWDCPI